MAINPRRRAPKPRDSGGTLRERLRDAEATLEAIRAGRVDALVVSGPSGEQTRFIEGAEHPYFILLDAMGDGAALLEPNGAILFGNVSFGELARRPVESLRGHLLQDMVVAADRARLTDCVRNGARRRVAGEFTLATAGAPTPVAISLSSLALGARPVPSARDERAILVATVVNLTEAKAAEAMRAALLDRVLTSETEERRRIARELHDETGQSLTALLVGLRAIATMSAQPAVRQAALRLRDVAADTVDNVGRLARGLHPAVLDDLGLAAAARRYVRDYRDSFGTDVDLVVGNVDKPALPRLVAATVYRILQETLTNVARHAQAKRIVITLARVDTAVELRVQDNGVGFEVDRVVQSASALGLHGMLERVAALGGSLAFESRRGSGTAVHTRIPVVRAGRGAPRARRAARP